MEIWAHRGASDTAPENTLPSFKKAAELGADGVELDIQLTRDGEIIVIHDEIVDRTTNGSGFVKDYTLSEIKSLDASYQNLMQGYTAAEKAKKFPEFSNVKIPTMKEVFELLKPTGLKINIELKTGIIFYPGIVDKILKLTRDEGMEDRVVYSSFNHNTIREIQKKNPDSKTALLFSDVPCDIASYASDFGVWAAHPAIYHLQDTSLISKCHEKGLKVNVWAAETAEFIGICAKFGADTVITSYPDIALKILNK